MRIAYTVNPLVPVLSSERQDDFLVEHKKMNYWDFLNLNVSDQLCYVAFIYLHVKGRISDHHKTTLSLKQFDTDSIKSTVSEHVLAYINYFGKRPSTIICGTNIHNELFCMSSLSYKQSFNFMNNRQDYFLDVKVVLVRHMEGFVLLD